tara:strand:+ start:2085 stop:2417 length:333 start_codon:yes stop_codon:yes gene_type:complete
MRIYLAILGILLVTKDCGNYKKCTCEGVRREIKYVEYNFVIDPTPFQYEGTLKITKDTVEKKPDLNRHIAYLNKCTDHQVKPAKYFDFNVYKKDIDTWKEYIWKNCTQEE